MKSTYLACCAMIGAFGSVFCLTTLVHLPMPWYHPLDHQWLIESHPHTLAMGFYGQMLYATAAAALAFGIGRWFGKRSDRPLTGLWIWFALGLAPIIAALVLAGHQIANRRASPPPARITSAG